MDYRNYIRSSPAGFDGATLETAVYTPLRFTYTTTATGAVGRWSPASLGRSGVASMARVMLQGVIAPGDFVRVIDSSGGTRFDLPASLESSGWFFLGPADTIAVSAAGATRADILVNDLNDPQLQLAQLIEATQALGTSAPAPLTTVASPLAIDAFTRGTFYVTGTAGGATTVDLATVADFGVGARIVLRNATAFAYTIDPFGGQTINGAATLVVPAGGVVSVEAAATQWIALLT